MHDSANAEVAVRIVFPSVIEPAVHLLMKKQSRYIYIYIYIYILYVHARHAALHAKVDAVPHRNVNDAATVHAMNARCL